LRADRPTTTAAALAALGIVYGNLGTSPLYTYQVIVGAVGGHPSAADGGDVPRILKLIALAAGLTHDAAARISGHSSRIGAACDMVAYGVELPALMQAGGRRTGEMVARYSRRLDAKRSDAAKLAMLQNRG
jgi:hypothetical protein